MNGDTKIVNENTNPVAQDDQVVPQAPFQSPTGSANKEMGPISSIISELKPSGTEVNHEISQELKDIGIEEKKDNPELTDEHKQIGMNHAGASIPTPSQPSGSVSMPLTREEALADLKIKKPTDSAWGFDKLVLKVLDALGF